MSPTPQLLGGRYEVAELIGRGGMAEVHLGYDTRLGRQVAIKMLRSDLARDPAFLARFRREAQSAAGLNHAAIVAVYDSGEDQTIESGGAPAPIPYIVMEFVEGKTLRELLNETSPMPPAEAARVTEEVLDALAYSHRMGIVHRDIKPANVMISTTGDVKVMDFGIARAVADANATMTQTQAVIGTAQYLSPEQAQGHSVDARSDLYSTGCLLFELLTGRTPFSGDSPVAIAYQHVGQPPPRPSSLTPDISADLDAVVLHSLAKDREARYQTASSFRADLQSARLGRPISAAARGTAAGAVGVAAAATQAISPLAGVEDLTGGGDPEHGNTATLPAIGRDPDDEQPGRRRGVAYVLLTMAVVGALVLLAFAASNYLDRQDATAKQATVPSVVGKPQAVAEAAVRAAGLVPDSSDVTSDKEKGTVVEQTPIGNDSVTAGSQVSLSISSGPGQVAVPDLAGYTEAEAKTALGNLNLVAGASKTVDGSTVDKGKVINTSPASGETVDQGATVVLNVSSGLVRVPSVLGRDRSEAVRTLGDLGFKVDTKFARSGRPENSVIAQTRGGELTAYGSTITITVAQPAPPTPTTTTPTTTTPPPTTPATTPVPTPTTAAATTTTAPPTTAP